MEYIKKIIENDTVLYIAVSLIVIIAVAAIVVYIIRRRNSQVMPDHITMGTEAVATPVATGIDNTLSQASDMSMSNNKPTPNTAMNPEEILNNSFVASAEENAAKRNSMTNTAEVNNNKTNNNI